MFKLFSKTPKDKKPLKCTEKRIPFSLDWLGEDGMEKIEGEWVYREEGDHVTVGVMSELRDDWKSVVTSADPVCKE